MSRKKKPFRKFKTLEELKTVGQNKYTKYVLKNDIDASSVTTETAVVKGIFKGEFDGGGFTIKGLKKPLFEKVQEGTVRNLKDRKCRDQQYRRKQQKRSYHKRIKPRCL